MHYYFSVHDKYDMPLFAFCNNIGMCYWKVTPTEPFSLPGFMHKFVVNHIRKTFA